MSQCNGVPCPATAREAAAWYLSHSLTPVPVPTRSKNPGFDGWQTLRVGAEDLDQYFPPGKIMNLALLNGSPSGNLLDVDLDCEPAILAAQVLLPPTGWRFGRVSAPGSHHIFRTEVPLDAAQEGFADLNGKMLVELRGTGGCTIVPPSVHKSGEAIRWEVCTHAALVPLEDLRKAVRAVAVVALLAQHWPAVGRRDKAFMALAGGLLRMGLNVEATEKMLLAFCAATRDEESRSRVCKAAATAAKQADGKQTTGWPELMRHLVGCDAKAVVCLARNWLLGQSQSDAGGSSPLDWPEPIPLHESPDVPAFPVDVLPGWLRTWATAQAVELQVPVDLPALLALGLVGAGIARKFVVKVRDGFVEPTNIYCMVALPPGERKTQTFKKVLQPVKELERRLQDDAKPRIAAGESEYRVTENRLKRVEGLLAKAEDNEERGRLRDELKHAQEDLARIEVPVKPLLYTEDDTPASLKLEIIKQGGRLMVATTEAQSLDNITRYSERPDFDVYLKGHAGDELKTGRISRGRDSIDDPALSCLLSPQPVIIQGLAEIPALRSRGFLARWLYALPVSRVGERAIASPAVPADVRDLYHRHMRRVWETDYGTDEVGEPAAHVLRLTPAAERAFRDFESWIEPRLGADGLLQQTAGWGNKLNGACARLAAAIHVAETFEQGTDPAGPIDEHVMGRAVLLCRDYLIPHALAAFDIMGVNLTVARAKRVCRWVERERLQSFKVRDCFRAHRSMFSTVDELRPILDLLEKHYLIRPQSWAHGEGRGRGRPASPVYDVNPGGGPAGSPLDIGQKCQNGQNSSEPLPDPEQGGISGISVALHVYRPGNRSICAAGSVSVQAGRVPKSRGLMP